MRAPSRRSAILRPVSLADTEEVIRQRLDLFRAMGDIPERDLPPYVPRFRRWFRRELRAGRLWGFLAVGPVGRPVGGGLLWLQPRTPSPRFPESVAPYVFSVFVEPEHRGRGLGTRIMRALIESARARGFARIELHSTDAGRGLYEQLGFRPTTQLRLALRRPHRASTRRRTVAGRRLVAEPRVN